MKYPFASSLLSVVSLILFSGADWLQFRGSQQNPVAPNSKPPLQWNVEPGQEQNLAWKIDLPGRGVSSPIVVKDRVIVTSASGYKQDRLHVNCFSTKDGKQLWERQFWATGRTLCHPTSSVAANTPASDGNLIFAFFSSNDLFCLDLDGNLKWFRGLTLENPTAANDIGMSASPVVSGNVVIVQVENKGESFAAGIDTRSGETVWQVERYNESNWTSPAILLGKSPEEDVVLLQSPVRLTAHLASNGEQLWSLERPCAGISSVVAVDNLIYLPSEGLTALRHQPGRTLSEPVWREATLRPGNASPLIHNGKVYVINSAGVLMCGNAITGESEWKIRLKGPFWASPVLAGNYLFAFNQEGLGQVVDLSSGEGKIVSENPLNDPVLGSPAVVGNAVFVRSDHRLWKIGE